MPPSPSSRPTPNPTPAPSPAGGSAAGSPGEGNGAAADPSQSASRPTGGGEPRETVGLASRLAALAPYPFTRINQLTYNARRAGRDVIDMSMGNPSDPPVQSIIDRLTEAANDPRNHGYASPLGMDALRREVAARYRRRWGVMLDPEAEVLCTLGSKEGMGHLCLAVVGPGDDVVAPAPTYPAHLSAVVLAGGRPVAVETTDPAAFLAGVSRLCATRVPKLVIVSFPHNPTGTVLAEEAGTTTADQHPHEFYVELIALARRHSFLVASDLAYADIAFDGYRPPSLLAVDGAKRCAVEFTTMSKGYNMAGWRVGFCAGNRDLVLALATVKTSYDYGMFRPIQIAAITALREGDDAVDTQALVYQRRRDVLCGELARVGWPVTPPRAGMFVWAPIPPLAPAGKPAAGMVPSATGANAGPPDSTAFAARLLDEADVAVSPGAGFGPLGEGFVRMALIENEARLRLAARRIAPLLAGGQRG
ncbi:MAG: aminotransferase class I/II-fold pyridoxal phosphate-dependent enzyme [Planctomycetota bacterium]|nr:MAG: aminotransferase class I/II-fold pyridoxal phosphate-dependent enzyme [Planctomycetota bacterium]